MLIISTVILACFYYHYFINLNTCTLKKYVLPVWGINFLFVLLMCVLSTHQSIRCFIHPELSIRQRCFYICNSVIPSLITSWVFVLDFKRHVSWCLYHCHGLLAWCLYHCHGLLAWCLYWCHGISGARTVVIALLEPAALPWAVDICSLALKMFNIGKQCTVDHIVTTKFS